VRRIAPRFALLRIDPGVATLVEASTGRRVSVPWPRPAPREAPGAWVPAVLQRHEDGTALALWRWEDGRDPC
jgi:hypothetical protein